MTGTLPTDSDVARYREDGAVCLRGAFGSDWIDRLRGAVEADLAELARALRAQLLGG